MNGAAVVFAALLATPAGASAYVVRLDASQCLPLAAAEAAALGPGWAAFASYAQRCVVKGPNGRVALTVDIVRLDHVVAADAFYANPDQRLPLPILRDASGRAAGTLPEGFPIDPPGALRVTFADWRHGWPWRIDLFEAGESALAPHEYPPLCWVPGRSAYFRPEGTRCRTSQRMGVGTP